MFRNGIIFQLFALFFSNVSATESIEFQGEQYHAIIKNYAELGATIDPAVWADPKTFTKLVFSEQSIKPEAVKLRLLNAASRSSHQFQLAEYGKFRQSDVTLIFKELIQGSEFIRLHKLARNNVKSLMLTVSFPTSLNANQQDKLYKTISDVVWFPHELLVISDEPLIKISIPEGFYLSQKYANSLVFRSAKDNLKLPDAILVCSYVQQSASSQTLQEETKNILYNAKSMELMKIHSISDIEHSEDRLVIARASGRISDSQIDVDISHVSKALGNSILIAQLITVEHTESFLQSEEVLIQTLNNLHFATIDSSEEVQE